MDIMYTWIYDQRSWMVVFLFFPFLFGRVFEDHPGAMVILEQDRFGGSLGPRWKFGAAEELVNFQ